LAEGRPVKQERGVPAQRMALPASCGKGSSRKPDLKGLFISWTRKNRIEMRVYLRGGAEPASQVRGGGGSSPLREEPVPEYTDEKKI